MDVLDSQTVLETRFECSTSWPELDILINVGSGKPCLWGLCNKSDERQWYTSGFLRI